MDVLKFGFRYWKRNLFWSIFAKFLSALALTADLLLPLLTAMFINYVIKGEESTEEGIFSFLLDGRFGKVHSMELFWNLAIVFFGLIVLKQVLVYTKNIIHQKIGLRLETDLREVTFHKLMTLDSETISAYNTGELLTTINSDTIMFKEMFCRMIPNILDSIYVLIVSSIMLAKINPWFLSTPILITPFFVISLKQFRKKAVKNFQNIRGSNSEMSLAVQENIEAVRLVRSFTNEEEEKAKFDEKNQKLKQDYIKQVKLSADFEAIFATIRQLAYIGTVTVAAILVMRGQIMLGYLVACIDYVFKIMNYITMINNTMFQMQQQIVSGHKMLDFVNCETKIPDGTKEVLKKDPVNICISHASMVLGESQVLSDINLEITSGKKVGIVGGTGSGKSMLLESLIRIHDVTSGEITLNGVDIRDYELNSLRDKFAYVFQEVFLFSNTIDSNIAYSHPDIEREQVFEAAKHARAHSFIQKLEEGYETIVGERGLGISGGQKQRVSIARALLKDAPILVLDDSTSALDVETEKNLLENIRKFYPEKTLLITAHRLSSVVDCDEILYMQDGRIIERGTFDELMKLDGHFASVYRIQQAQKSTVVDYDGIGGEA